jgi:hypothetical protein
MKLSGGCFCGAVRYQLSSRLGEDPPRHARVPDLPFPIFYDVQKLWPKASYVRRMAAQARATG